jgi:hypothetical protein
MFTAVSEDSAASIFKIEVQQQQVKSRRSADVWEESISSVWSKNKPTEK